MGACAYCFTPRDPSESMILEKEEILRMKKFTTAEIKNVYKKLFFCFSFRVYFYFFFFFLLSRFLISMIRKLLVTTTQLKDLRNSILIINMKF